MKQPNQERPKCETKFCRGKALNKRKRCAKCEHRRVADRDYVRYVYNYWKANCKRRGRENTVTLEQFRKFVSDNGYIERKGKEKYSLCIDRRDNNRGYHLDNIRTITLSANSIKRHTEDHCPF